MRSTFDGQPSYERERQQMGTCGKNFGCLDLVASKRVQIEPTVTHVLHGIEKVPEAIEITGNKAKYGAIGPVQVVLV